MRVCGVTTISLLMIVVGAAAAMAGPLPLLAPEASSREPNQILPVVVFGRNARRLPESFAAEHGLDPDELTRQHLASGLIQCGNAHGAGQLTLTDDVITTAAHVFYDETGVPRSSSCSFKITVDGRESQVPVDLSSIVAGSTRPYDVAVSHDWAVARLTRPLSGVRPYGLADGIHDDEPVTFVARGHIDWGVRRRCRCRIACCTINCLRRPRRGRASSRSIATPATAPPAAR